MMWSFDRFGDNIALIDEDGKQTTYAELQIESERLVSRLDGRFLAFVLCANEKGALLGYAAFINGNSVPVMLDAALDFELLSALTESYKPDYIWMPRAMAHMFTDCAEVYTVWDYVLLKTPYGKAFPLYGGLALLLTTSGSTGSPKFVRQSYTNIRANTESIVEYLELSETERPITTMPMSYTYGLSIINSHLWVGASIILTQKALMQKEFWRQFKDFGATSFGGVPYIYEMLDKLRFFRMDLPSLKTMTQAGGKLSPELHKKFAEYAKQTGKRFIVMYGQTEATARMSYLPHDKALEKCGSMGIAIPGGKFSLINSEGGEIREAETVGEFVYSGKNVTLGYAECGADLAKGDERGGVLVTGDMAKRDTDGFYYIVGRKKRFLKIFGNRVNLDEAERLVKTAFYCECACCGVDDKMFIFLTNAALAEDARKFISVKTGLNLSAFCVKVIEKIPKNEAGKTLYSALEGLI